MNNYITLYGEPLEYPHQVRLELGRETTEDGDDLIVNAGVLKLKDLGKEIKGNAEE